MANSVYPRLFVGSDSDCLPGTPHQVVVHACKSPCHQEAVGYKGSLQKDHPNYLSLESDFALYLNIIDPPVPLFMIGTFEVFLRFVGHHWDLGRDVLIHCNQGESRSPSLAMLFLASRGLILDESYEAAIESFDYKYYPSMGIEIYLGTHWEELLNGKKD